MPNIQEYEAKGEITPSDKGINAAEMAGRRIGQFYHQIAGDIAGVQEKIEQHESLVEISHVARNMSDGEAGLNDLWSQITTDPTTKDRPDLASTFMKEKVEPFIEKMQGLAGTQAGKEYALRTGDRIRQQFWHETQGDQAALTANTVHENAERVGNNATVSAARDAGQKNYQDQLDAVKQTADTFEAALRPRPGQAGEAGDWHQQYIERHSRDVVIAHYQSQAAAIATEVGLTGDETKSPTYITAKTDYAADLKGQDWVKGSEWVALGDGLDKAVNQGKELFRSRDADQRRKDSDDFNAALLPIETHMFKDNGAGGVAMAVSPDMLDAVNKLLSMPGAAQDPKKVSELLNAMHTATQDQITGKETVTDKSVYNALSVKIGSTTDPLTTTEVDKARAAHLVSDSDYSFLRSSAVDSKLANPKTIHALTDLHRYQESKKSIIDQSDPLFGKTDLAGAQQYSNFMWDTEHKLRQAIASGEDPDAALQRLTDPRNPRGFDHFLPQYQAPAGKPGRGGGIDRVINAMKSGGSQAIPAPPGGIRPEGTPQRLPGESMDAYDKRIHQ